MITGFFGDLGSGKTLTMTKYAYLHHMLGYKVYSNYKLSFSDLKVDKEFLERVVEKGNDEILGDKVLFALDEFDMYVDSRRSMNKGNLLISYFIKQIRKKNIKLFYTVQAEHMVDKRLRNLTRCEVSCRGKDFSIYKEGVVDPYMIKIVYNDIYVNGDLVSKKRFVGNPFFKLYNTKELITID